MPDSWLGRLPGVREREPLAQHSWYGIGGPAAYFLEVSDPESLGPLIARVRQDAVPYFVLGAGSNTLIADAGLPGLTLKMASDGWIAENGTVLVRAGALMPTVAAQTARAGRAGLEFGAGVPGTAGASVAGNAGAFGTEVKDRLIAVETLDVDGQFHTLDATACAFAYRDSTFKHHRRGWTITAARFRVEADDPARIRERILAVQQHRRETQPVERRSLGSTFKNPPGDAAGRLIDACGLKGHRVGGAQISPKHANFIVNLGGARAVDVLALIAEMRDRVEERFSIILEPEIQFLGIAPP